MINDHPSTSATKERKERTGYKQSSTGNNVSPIRTIEESLSSAIGSNVDVGTPSFMSLNNSNNMPVINLSKSGLITSHAMLLPKSKIHNQVITTPTKTDVNSSSDIMSPPSHSPLDRKRIRSDFEVGSLDSKERPTPNRFPGEKSGKGLRHFSTKVCEKVQLKGVTSYNEVADELVTEFAEQSASSTDQLYDQKNIRRRVYDALNVLMAMNIISKEKKEIKWVGLPTNSAQECTHLEGEKMERLRRIKQKQQQLRELIVQQIAYKNLVERNKKLEKTSGSPQLNACIHLPFIIVNTSKKTVIDCSISSDKSEYLFNFDEAFEIHDDIEVLKRMGLSFGLEKGTASEKELKTVSGMIPKALEPCIRQIANGSFGKLEFTELCRHSSQLETKEVTHMKKYSAHDAKKTHPRQQSFTLSRESSQAVSHSSVASDYESENEGDEENSAVVD